MTKKIKKLQIISIIVRILNGSWYVPANISNIVMITVLNITVFFNRTLFQSSSQNLDFFYALHIIGLRLFRFPAV